MLKGAFEEELQVWIWYSFKRRFQVLIGFDWPKSAAPKSAKSLLKVLSAYKEGSVYSLSTAFLLFVLNLNCVKTITDISLRYWYILRKACILNDFFVFIWKKYMLYRSGDFSFCCCCYMISLEVPSQIHQKFYLMSTEMCWKILLIQWGLGWFCLPLWEHLSKGFYKGSPSNSMCLLMCLFPGNLDNKHNTKV